MRPGFGTLVIDPNGEFENDGRIFSGGDVEIYPTDGAGPVAIVAGLEWARLFSEAAAMHLALALICAGVASIATVTPPGFASFSEFVFDGTHYALSDGRSWTDVINLAGWTRCRAALAAAKGDTK